MVIFGDQSNFGSKIKVARTDFPSAMLQQMNCLSKKTDLISWHAKCKCNWTSFITGQAARSSKLRQFRPWVLCVKLFHLLCFTWMAARVKIKINLNIDTNLVYYNTNAKVERVEIKDARLPVQLQVWYTSKSKQV